MSRGNADEYRIDLALSRAAARAGYEPEVVMPHSPLDELLRTEAGEEEEQREMLGLVLDYFFADGRHPGSVLRRVYAVARAIRPRLIGHMNGTELALMFGETRAAQAWRVKKIFSGYLQERGAKGFKATFQKSESSTPKYAAAARGNQNRRGKTTNQKAA